MPTVGAPSEAAVAAPPSKSVQPIMLPATGICLSPFFAGFAPSFASENRGVGSSILPLTTDPDPGFQERPGARILHLESLVPGPSRAAPPRANCDGRFLPDLSAGHVRGVRLAAR
jgi:hypothetical protein